MSKIAKIMTLGGIAGVLVLVGFGCKGLSAQQKAAIQPVTLEFWTVYDDVPSIRAIIEKYTKDRPYIKINVRQLRSDELYTRFVESLADDQGPDIISINSRDLGAYISRLQPMPPATKDTVVTVQKGQFQDTTTVTTIPRNMITIPQLQKEFVQTVYADAVRNGKIYGLPLSLDVMAIYYNKDLLDRAGIPEAPKTWEEFQADVKLLTKYNKTTGKITQAGAALGTGNNVPNSSDILNILFGQSKVPFTDKSGKAVFDIWPANLPKDQQSPAMSVLDFYTDFANSARDTYTWNETMPDALDAFVNGQLAFFFGYSYQYQTIKSRAPQMNMDVIPMLQLSEDNIVNVANYSLQTVVGRSKHASEAWTLIDYITHSGANKTYLESTHRPTALRVYIADQKKDTVLGPFASQVLTAESWYRGRDYKVADQAIRAMFAEWMKPATDDKILDAHQIILKNAAQTVNQTL